MYLIRSPGYPVPQNSMHQALDGCSVDRHQKEMAVKPGDIPLIAKRQVVWGVHWPRQCDLSSKIHADLIRKGEQTTISGSHGIAR